MAPIKARLVLSLSSTGFFRATLAHGALVRRDAGRARGRSRVRQWIDRIGGVFLVGFGLYGLWSGVFRHRWGTLVTLGAVLLGTGIGMLIRRIIKPPPEDFPG